MEDLNQGIEPEEDFRNFLEIILIIDASGLVQKLQQNSFIRQFFINFCLLSRIKQSQNTFLV